MDIVADVGNGLAVEHTATMELVTNLGLQCGYTYSISSSETWLTITEPSATSIKASVQSTDLSLVGQTFTFTVTMTPDYVESTLNTPVPVSYQFDVSFTCLLTTFDIQPFSINYVLASGPMTTTPFVVDQSPAVCAHTPTFSTSSLPTFATL